MTLISEVNWIPKENQIGSALNSFSIDSKTNDLIWYPVN